MNAASSVAMDVPSRGCPPNRFVQWCVSAWLVLGTLAAAAAAETLGSNPDSVILTVAGKVELAKAGAALWTEAKPGQSLKTGDRIRVGEKSRCTLRMHDRSVLHAGELTMYEIQAPREPRGRSRLSVLQGLLYFFSRGEPEEVGVETPLATAAIRGTEFSLEVAADGSFTLALLDGAVDLSNEHGSIRLAAGDQGSVTTGEAPRKSPLLEAHRKIQWVLYYPAVLDPNELEWPQDARTALAASLAAYQHGDVVGALGAYPANRSAATPWERLYHSGLLLAVGQATQAERTLAGVEAEAGGGDRARRLAAALKLLIASASGAELGSEVALAAPSTGTEWLALSYAEQARSRLEAARSAARQATTLAPGFGFAWARLAELEFSFGQAAAARQALEKALAQAPRHAQAHALAGYVAAAENRWQDAMADFDRAIELDGALGNAWLGRGLCRIHAGSTQQGRQDLQVAASREPRRGVFRSYLGKAFEREGDYARAAKELDLAQLLDANDPTAWLYSALVKRQANEINAAVRDLERSQELNANRSVYRSGFLLDQDRAVRSANLAAIYRDAGMADVSVREATRAVSSDYANYSAHLFLANSYNEYRDPRQINLRYETPTFNELLIANLLAPVGAGALSQNISQLEYARFFERDHVGLASGSDYRSAGDWSQYVSQYGTVGNVAYALDVNYRSQNGQRENEDFSEVTFYGKVKVQLSPKDSVLLQTIYYDNDAGDLNQYYDQNQASAGLRLEEQQQPSVLLGYHHEWQPGVHTLFLGGRLIDDSRVTYPDRANALLGLAGGSYQLLGLEQLDLSYASELEIYTAELQQIWQQENHSLVAGLRYQDGSFDTAATQNNPSNYPFLFPPSDNASSDSIDPALQRFTAYAYYNWRVFEPLVISAGIAYEHMDYPYNFRLPPLSTQEPTRERVLPKAGLIWTPTENTTLRASYSQSLGGVSLDQSFRLEPTQIGGFLQSYRSLLPESVSGALAGADFEILGVGIDHRFSTGTYVGVDVERLESDASRGLGAFQTTLAPPTATPVNVNENLDYEERALLVTVNQLLGEHWSLGGRYRLSDVELDDTFDSVSGGQFANKSTLHQGQAFVLFNHRCGFFARADSLWTQQSNRAYSPDRPGDDFWQFNAFLGYRFKRRVAEARLGLLNFTDQDYQLNPLNYYAELPRERMFTASFKFSF
jgi:Tfp pilus assembly protein PilF